MPCARRGRSRLRCAADEAGTTIEGSAVIEERESILDHPDDLEVLHLAEQRLIDNRRMGIRLTPAGRLRWESSGDEAAPAGSQSLQHTFESDWREALFTLAAGRVKHLPLRKALEQYAGAKNRPALVKLLSPIQQAAEVCDWVKDLMDSGDVYRPMAWTAARAWRLLRSAAGPRGERAVREAAELVAAAAPAPGVGEPRCAGAGDARRRRDAGLQREGRTRRCLPVTRRAGLAARRRGRPGAAQGPVGRGGS